MAFIQSQHLIHWEKACKGRIASFTGKKNTYGLNACEPYNNPEGRQVHGPQQMRNKCTLFNKLFAQKVLSAAEQFWFRFFIRRHNVLTIQVK